MAIRQVGVISRVSDVALRVVGTYEHVPGYIDRVIPGL